MGTWTVSLWLVLACLAVTSRATSEVLAKLPDQDEVMISDVVPGLKLECPINGSSSEDQAAQVTWRLLQEGQDPADLQEFVEVNDKGHSQLRLPKEDSQVGVVECQWQDQTQSWRVKPFFKLEKWPQSEVVVEGNSHSLICSLRPDSLKVALANDPIFTWYKFSEDASDDQAIDITQANIVSDDQDDQDAQEVKVVIGDSHLTISSGRNQSKLSIEDAVYEDRSIYRCIASVNYTDGETLSATVETLIRVKDRYAALYPFIGIVCEVLALCLIIFLCERRKSSGDDDEDEEDTNEDSKDSKDRQDHKEAGNGSSNLRNRKN